MGRHEHDEKRAKLFSLMLECLNCRPDNLCQFSRFRHLSVEDKLNHAFRNPIEEVEELLQNHRSCVVRKQ